MAITIKNFGQLNNKTVNEYIISNDALSVSIMNVGATITQLITKDKNANLTNICLGFNTLEQYLQHQQYYLGCICGRYANRIASGKFTIDNNEYTLATNLPPHHLHGGVQGFNCKYWDAQIDDTNAAITFSYDSKDGEEGYPGNVTVAVTYSLKNATLVIDYNATTDMATPINLTNHAYFNLSGENTIANHYLQINSTQLMTVDSFSIPTGEFKNVNSTLYDFTSEKLLSQYYLHNELYDNSWLLSQPYGFLQKAAAVSSRVSGISMSCYTSFPSIHFYDGHFLDNPFYSKQGFCLEAQFLPDAPNQPNFPNTILQPNQPWQYQTIFEIGLL